MYGSSDHSVVHHHERLVTSVPAAAAAARPRNARAPPPPAAAPSTRWRPRGACGACPGACRLGRGAPTAPSRPSAPPPGGAVGEVVPDAGGVVVGHVVLHA